MEKQQLNANGLGDRRRQWESLGSSRSGRSQVARERQNGELAASWQLELDAPRRRTSSGHPVDRMHLRAARARDGLQPMPCSAGANSFLQRP